MLRYWNRYKNINLTLADQAIVSGCNFVTGIILARGLGVDQFGAFSLAWMIVLFINSIQMALISSPMMTVGPKQSFDNKKYYYGAVIIQQLLFSIFSAGLVFLFTEISGYINEGWNLNGLSFQLALMVCVSQNQDFLRRLLFCEQKRVIVILLDVVAYLGRVLILAYIFLIKNYKFDTGDTLLVFVVTTGLSLLFWLVVGNSYKYKLENICTVFKRHWGISKWMTASAIMQWTSGNLFVIVSGATLGVASVGALKASQNIVGVSHILFQALENFVPSRASRVYNQHGIYMLNSFLMKVAMVGSIFTSIVAIGIIIIPEQILSFFYGEAYRGYETVLRLYALSYVIMYLSLPVRIGLRVIENAKPIFFSYVIMTFFTLCSAQIFVTYWSVEGAVIGIICTQIISMTSLILCYKSTIKKFG